MLDLCGQRNQALGVDFDEGMIAHCRSKGHDVVSWMRATGATAGEQTVDVILRSSNDTFPTRTVEFIRNRAEYQTRGRWIAETVNPNSIAEGVETFGPTFARASDFPESLLMLCMGAGSTVRRVSSHLAPRAR